MTATCCDISNFNKPLDDGMQGRTLQLFLALR